MVGEARGIHPAVAGHVPDRPRRLEDLPGGAVLTMVHWRLRAMDQHMLRQGRISAHEFMRLCYNAGFRMPWLDPQAEPRFN